MLAKNLVFIFMSCCEVFLGVSAYRDEARARRGDEHLDVPLGHGSTFREVMAVTGDELSQQVLAEMRSGEARIHDTDEERLFLNRRVQSSSHHDRSVSENQTWLARPQLGLNDQPMLHNAVARGDVHTVRRLIRAGALVNDANENGRTALHVAALRGQHETARMLLQHEADVHAIDASGKIPLYYAAKYCHMTLVQLLVQAGTDQNCMMGIRGRPVHVAIACGYLNIAIYLIQQGAVLDEHSCLSLQSAQLQEFDLDVERGRLYDALEALPEPYTLPADVNRLVLAFISDLWSSPERKDEPSEDDI